MPKSSTTAGALVDRAVEAIRTLLHVTDRYDEGAGRPLPSGVNDVVEGLTVLTGLLPQLLDQMSQWLEAEGESGRFLVNGELPAGVDAGLTAAARLYGARESAAELCRQLGEARDALRVLDRPRSRFGLGVASEPRLAR